MMIYALLLAALGTLPAEWAAAQGAPDMQISWEVRNRFRLFREERDFLLHTDSAQNGSILESEQALELQSDGRGWARNTVNRLCIDLAGRISEPCTRDNVKENYLTPVDHPVTVRLTGQVPVGAICAWSFDDGGGPQQSTQDCAEPINLRARYGLRTVATVDVSSGSEAPQHLTTEIMVRDILIAGLGDSIASGEGDPDRAIALADEGFCFRSYLGTAGSAILPPEPRRLQRRTRLRGAGYPAGLAAPERALVQFSLPSLALQLPDPNRAGARGALSAHRGDLSAAGLHRRHHRRRAVRSATRPGMPAGEIGGVLPGTVNAQLAELRAALSAAKRRQPDRTLDLVLLSIGANDINFSGLVADVIVDTPTERELFRRTGLIGSVEDSRAALARDLPRGFAKLREALKPLVGDMSHVVYVSYANPALAGGAPCPGGRAGFDIHPSFNVDPQRLAGVSDYVQNEFLPQLKALALCQCGVLCRDPAADRMTFVDAHQAAFAAHGFCARAATDPEFDRECFSDKGDSFNSDIVTAANQPMVCGRSAGEYRAYLPRARWIRDANDSYFAAMTYPQGLPAASQPADIHDATWGVLSAVYGGAVHPTAEGHAAMADAALPAAAAVLHLDATVPEVTAEPAPPVAVAPPSR